MPTRFGIGYDAHRLVEGVPLVLAGVHVPHDRGLKGHSDGDVATHAIIDALLGRRRLATSAPTSTAATRRSRRAYRASSC